jgi:hypothetical protein
MFAEALDADVIALSAILRSAASKVEAEADVIASWGHGRMSSQAGIGTNGAFGFVLFFWKPCPGPPGLDCLAFGAEGGCCEDCDCCEDCALAFFCFLSWFFERAVAPSTSLTLRFEFPWSGMRSIRTVMLASAMGTCASSGRIPALDGARPPQHASESCLKISLSARSTWRRVVRAQPSGGSRPSSSMNRFTIVS